MLLLDVVGIWGSFAQGYILFDGVATTAISLFGFCYRLKDLGKALVVRTNRGGTSKFSASSHVAALGPTLVHNCLLLYRVTV